MSALPPFFDRFVAERACSHAINSAGDPCGKPPAVHVAWEDTPEGIEAGWVCDDHLNDLACWKPFQIHPPGPDCGMPGALWFLEENICRCTDEIADPVGEAVAREVVLAGASADPGGAA